MFNFLPARILYYQTEELPEKEVIIYNLQEIEDRPFEILETNVKETDADANNEQGSTS